jgi:hypothetical protein
MTLRRVTRLVLMLVLRMRRAIWLQTATVFWLGGVTISLSCSMYMGLVTKNDRPPNTKVMAYSTTSKLSYTSNTTNNRLNSVGSILVGLYVSRVVEVCSDVSKELAVVRAQLHHYYFLLYSHSLKRIRGLDRAVHLGGQSVYGHIITSHSKTTLLYCTAVRSLITIP